VIGVVARTCVAACVLLTVACATRSADPVGPPPQPAAPHVPASSSKKTLSEELDALFGAPALAHAQWGISVYSQRESRVIYERNAGAFMIPASNQKLLIAAAAADHLGWDFQFTTRLVTTAPIADDGTIAGDVVVIGNGDPTINTRDPLRWRAFDDWAAALRLKGVKTIRGRLIGDDNAFVEPGWGVGWAWDNLQYGYGAQVTALQFNESQVELLIGPGMERGAPAIIAVTPAGSGLVIDNRVVTAEPGRGSNIDIARVPGTPHLVVTGHVAAGARPASTFASVHDPTRYYLAAVQSAFARHGITVEGGILDADALDEPLAYDQLTELVVDRSARLLEIVDVALKWSRNIYAESLLLALAPRGEPASGTRGLRTVAEILQRWNIPPTAYLPRDGSGLSRYDYMSADVIVSLLRRMLDDTKHAANFQSALPVAGRSGTLAERMKGTAAEGRVHAKTGTLSNVRSLAGYATTLDGDTLVFAFMANNFRVAAAEINAAMEGALNRLIQRGGY
jgi:serine-type D-Ala-D-Ala carboxypeptidase/endopeptidase (penicillin-binding protein 4)